MCNEPIESNVYQGFFIVPGYSKYLINIQGNVLNLVEGYFLEGSFNPDGYKNYRITADDGKCLTWGRHRLLCYVFKHPGIDISDLVVNHLNGIKGDDRLINLEWTTYKGNAEHAGLNGLTEKCVPVAVRCVDTGNIFEFPSFVECGRNLGLSKDAISYRIKNGEERVYPERKQYRKGNGDTPWIVPNDIDLALLENTTSKQILVRCVLTGVIIVFDKLSDLAEMQKISPSTVTSWLNAKGQPVLPGFLQIKLATDTTPWRKVEDPYLELSKFTSKKIVQKTNSVTGDKKIYLSANECAIDSGLNPTALSYRLKSNGNITFSDSYRYGHYPY